MHTARIVFTVIMALILMGCPPPVSDNPGDSASGSSNSAQGGANPAPLQKHHVAYVSAGGFHTMIVKTDDTLWAVGNNDNRRLGDGSTDQKLNPVQVMEIPAEDGRPRAMTNVKQISAGSNYTMILKEDDSLWAVGTNDYGQLGDSSASQQQLNPIYIMSEVAQVSSGNLHTMILKKNDTLYGIGFNIYGQLGTRAVGLTNPVQVMEMPAENGELRAMTNVKQVSAGGSHTMILKRDDTLWGTGSNSSGQLGNGSTTNKNNPVQVMINVAQVSAGANYTMIIKKNGELWASSKNNKGQLGDGSTADKRDFVQVMEIPAEGADPRPMTAVAQVSAGKEHSMIVKKDGTLWAVGTNDSGQLGNGDEKLATRFNPEQITPVAGCHDYLAEDMGDIIVETR